VADYSEFPTTPTAWQEQHARDWETVTPLDTEDGAPSRRTVDLSALIPGVVFITLAIVLMTGVDLPLGLWKDGGFAWVLLIGGGVALLVTELRKARRQRR
jgi:hypothetical protein